MLQDWLHYPGKCLTDRHDRVCLTSIIRATHLKNTSTDITCESPRQTRPCIQISDVWILDIIVEELTWSSIEVTVAVICACIPSFKALITYKFPTVRRVLGLTSSGTASNSRGFSYHYGRMDKYSATGSHHGHVRMDKLPHSTTSRMDTDIHASDWEESEDRITAQDGIKVTTDLTVTRVDGVA